MSVVAQAKPYRMKLRVELTDGDGRTRIMEVDNLNFGRGIYFHNPETNQTEETAFTIEWRSELEDVSRLPMDLRFMTLPKSEREFLRIDLLAWAKPSEIPEWDGAFMREINPELYHELAEIHVCSKLLATYKCTCGKVGKATMPRRLYARQKNLTVEDLARKNHKSHAKRAWAAAERKKMVQ